MPVGFSLLSFCSFWRTLPRSLGRSNGNLALKTPPCRGTEFEAQSYVEYRYAFTLTVSLLHQFGRFFSFHGDLLHRWGLHR